MDLEKTKNYPCIDLNRTAGAEISRCRKYRYALWRTWECALPKVLFICLNPSTADAKHDDPTLRRCMAFARSWGYGGVCTANLYAFRATNPAALLSVKDPIGPKNNYWLRYLATNTALSVAAWGNHGQLLHRSSVVRQMIIGLHYLRINASGEPAHPLYLPKSLQPQVMTEQLPGMSENVAKVFLSYPDNARKKLEQLRELIFKVAQTTDGVGVIDETLKWGEPAYVTAETGSGSTIRIKWKAKSPKLVGIYFICHTRLVDTFRCLFPDVFEYKGNRALMLPIKGKLAKKELAWCISLALRYHLDKSK